MVAKPFDFVQLLRNVAERRDITRMYRFWLTEEEMNSGDNMLAIHYVEALKDPKKRAAVFKKLSLQAKTLVGVLLHYKNRYSRSTNVTPTSPLDLQIFEAIPGDPNSFYASDLLGIASAYVDGLNLSHLVELHYYGVAFYKDAALWPSGEYTDVHAEGRIILAPGFDEDNIPLEKSKAGDVVPEPPEFKPDKVELNTKNLQFFLDFFALAEKGSLRYSLVQSRFYAGSQDLLDKIMPPVEKRTAVFEYILRFAVENNLLCMDSTGIIAPGPALRDFRLKPPARQVIEYCNWRASCPTILREGIADARFFYIENHAVNIALECLRSNPDSWISIEKLLTSLTQKLNDYLVPGKFKRDWEYGKPEIKPFEIDEINDYCLIFLDWRFVKTGMLHLGINADGTKYLKLSELGKAWCNLGPIPKFDSSKSQLIVKSDFEIILINSGPFDENREFLELFAVKDKTSTYESSIFHLTQKSIQEANSNGRPAEMLIEFLKKNATTAVPDNVVATLRDWVTNEITLHRDACLFSFEKPEAARSFLEKGGKRFKLIGDRILMCNMSEDAILKLLTNSRIGTVDYSLQSSEFITVTQENEVIFDKAKDFRIISLAKKISEPEIGEDGKKHYYLSPTKIYDLENPKATYQKLSHIFSTDTSLMAKLRILRYMELLPPHGSVSVLSNCPTVTRQQLQRKISWFRCIIIQVGHGQFVIKNEYLEEVRKAVSEQEDRRCVIQTFPLI